jgi:hypothetical protein
MHSIRRARLLQALSSAGFVVFRDAGPATLLERGGRGVAVPRSSLLPPETVYEVRRMAGLSTAELDALLAAPAGELNESTSAAVRRPHLRAAESHLPALRRSAIPLAL